MKELAHSSNLRSPCAGLQGFPNFESPGFVKEAALAAVAANENQVACTSTLLLSLENPSDNLPHFRLVCNARLRLRL